MKANILALFAASFLVAACETGGRDNFLGGTPVDPINPENPEEVEAAGQELYSLHCAECHGSEGQGSALAFQIQNPIINYATFLTRNGRTSVSFDVDMPAFSESALSNDEMNSVFYFLRQAPKPTDGAGLFARFCANCHGSDGRGGEVNVDVVEEAQDKPEEVLETVREGEGVSAAERFEYMPKFSQDDLTDAEVNKITQFLLSL